MPSGEIEVKFKAKPFRLLASATHYQHFSIPQKLRAIGGTAANSITHGGAFTLTGSGFGTKSRSLFPIVRDKGAAANGTVDPQWNTADTVPRTSSNSAYNIQNHDVGFAPTGATIDRPHTHVPRILAGCNGGASGTDGNSGISIQAAALVNPSTTTLTFPLVVYGSCWYRADPNWQFGIGNPTDKNYKHWAWSDGSNEGYCAYAPNHPANTTETSIQLCTSVAPSIYQNPDANGHGAFWPSSSDAKPPYVNSVNPFNATQGVNGWIFEEWESLITPTTGLGGGYMIVKQFGQQVINYAGATDAAVLVGNRRALFLGGYNRDYPSANNWRYYADLMVDATAMGGSAVRVARVMFGNQPTLAASTRLAPADLTFWGDSSITGTFWAGPFTAGNTVYAHVVCESGAVFDAAKSFTVS